MRTLSAAAWTLLALLSLLAVKGLGQDLDLSDAFDDLSPSPTPKPKPKEPAGGAGTGGDLELSDVLDDEPTPKPPVQPKVPVKPKPKPEETHSNFFAPTVRPALLPRTTIRPLRTSAPPRKVQDDFEDLELIDALDPSNDIGGKGKDPSKGHKSVGGGGGRGGGRPNIRGGNGGGTFTDEDLLDVGNSEGYKPDPSKGGRGAAGSGDLDSTDNGDYDTMAETGTIAGIVSAVAMALVGAVSSYISYQKKKFCFSIQQSLNADMVKADNPEAVVAQEPQVQQTLLQPPNAEPPAEDNAV
ncbi:CD99 antigen-like protein 2 isoform X1 [Pygocentrus nattereri]|uniref:CD99 antigen-like protein 2 n=1 Tax=Pygocentrus nattereri TaxID=42514 RepID=A0A3B4CNG7_PYGNA|nr:CD99 antigen-like protein 2 isoform X1 [Pygocentrus nattereri]